MKRLMVAACAAVLGIGASAVQAQHLPAFCDTEIWTPPAYFLCPSEYVELVAVEHDKMFERNAQCPETQHLLGLLRPEVMPEGGCAASSMAGWALPRETNPTGTEAVLRAEIMKHVIRPCYGVAVERYGMAEDGNHDEMVEMLIIVQAAAAEELIAMILPTITRQPDESARRVYYALGRQSCVESLGS